MALNKRERTMLIGTITLVALGLNYLLVAPLVGNWRTMQAKLVSQRHELEGMQDTIARKPEWKASYEALGSSLKQSQQFETASDVLKKIEEVGGNAGILIQSRRVLRVENRDVYRELPVQCNFESTDVSLVKFLYGLQTASGFMTVENLAVTSKPDNSNILRCDIQIRALAAATEKPAS